MGLHSDDESCMVKDVPIFSYTLLTKGSLPRVFSIYQRPDIAREHRTNPDTLAAKAKSKAGNVKHDGIRRAKKVDPERITSILLHHGDLVIMLGAMQRDFLHGVDKATPPSMYKNSERINLTVRAFHDLY